MNEMLEVEISENQEQTISARKLHEFLQSKERFSKWFEKVLEYDFVEGVDYTPYQMVHPQNNQELLDYKLKIDMAKEASMASKLPMGKVARQYFIQIEKDWNSPEKTMARALLMADKKIKTLAAVTEQQAKQIEEEKPLVLFAKTVQVAKDSMLVREFAKIVCQTGFKIGGNQLYQWMRDNGYLIKKLGKDYNKPTQKSTNLMLFELGVTTIQHNSGKITEQTTPYVTGKGQIYFVNKFKEMLNQVKAELIDFEDARALKEGAAQ